MFLWGQAGCGKTHLASTAPGKLLWLNFDPDGLASIKNKEDVIVKDFTTEHDSCVNQVKEADPFGIGRTLQEDPNISTIVVDSVTSFVSRAVAYSAGHKYAPGSVFENPGPSGYGFRNRFTLGLCKSVLLATAKYDRHCILIGHEDTPTLGGDGGIQEITVLLGGSLKQEVPSQISEVWHMQERNLTRYVQVRQVGLFKPMKTRMFNASKVSEFEASTPSNENKVILSDLFQQWKDNNYNKLELPK
jgi:hypothetical protein